MKESCGTEPMDGWTFLPAAPETNTSEEFKEMGSRKKWLVAAIISFLLAAFAVAGLFFLC